MFGFFGRRSAGWSRSGFERETGVEQERGKAE